MRSSVSNFMILRVNSSPVLITSSGRFTRPSDSSETWSNPSMPSGSSTKAPKSVIRTTLPVRSIPIRYFSGTVVFQGSGWVCFRPREIRRAILSTCRTMASTRSPFFRISEGCFTRLVQDMSEIWMSPSIPSSSSMKAPKSTRFRTFPSRRVPTGYRCSKASHGLGSTCFIPSEIRREDRSTSRTTTSTTSPTVTTLEGCLTRWVQDISEIWTRPSTPGSNSTNAP